MPIIQYFDLDESVVAPTVYRGLPHRATNTGVIIEQEIILELNYFLEEFLRFTGYDHEQLFFRIDAFLREEGLDIIEVNVELQEGWGIALNLLRAAGRIPQMPRDAELPARFVITTTDYLAELQLACQEFKFLGHEASVEVVEDGSTRATKHPLDSKIHLARFCPHWWGEQVAVPHMYHVDYMPWQGIPPDVVFKFCQKYGPESAAARYSVIRRRAAGRAKHLRECYNRRALIAQQCVQPARSPAGEVTQAVILCAQHHPITGYLQVAPPDTFVINDKTGRAGPLVFL